MKSSLIVSERTDITLLGKPKKTEFSPQISTPIAFALALILLSLLTNLTTAASGPFANFEGFGAPTCLDSGLLGDAGYFLPDRQGMHQYSSSDQLPSERGQSVSGRHNSLFVCGSVAQL